MLIKLLLGCVVFFLPILSENICKNQQNCEDCLFTPNCYWYYNFRNTSDEIGCYTNDEVSEKGLLAEYIFTRPTELNIKADRSLNEDFVDTDGVSKKVMIQPQVVKLLARLNESVVIPFFYTPPNKNVTSVKMEAISKRMMGKFSILIFSNCSVIQTDTCDNLKLGDVVQFNVEITPIECPKNPYRAHQKIQITPAGLKQHFLIELHIMCYCPCSFPKFPFLKRHAKECHGHGSLSCGVCRCNDGFIGRTCQCERGINNTCVF